jgi:hypothetical protein
LQASQIAIAEAKGALTPLENKLGLTLNGFSMDFTLPFLGFNSVDAPISQISTHRGWGAYPSQLLHRAGSIQYLSCWIEIAPVGQIDAQEEQAVQSPDILYAIVSTPICFENF